VTSGEESFYVVAATVLPVLFLALTVEQSLMTRWRDPGTWREFVANVLAYPATILLMASSEVTALAALLEENTSGLLLFVTTLGLLVCGALVLDRAMQTILDEIENRTRSFRKEEWIWLVTLTRWVARGFLMTAVVVLLGLVVFD